MKKQTYIVLTSNPNKQTLPIVTRKTFPDIVKSIAFNSKYLDACLMRVYGEDTGLLLGSWEKEQDWNTNTNSNKNEFKGICGEAKVLLKV